MPCPFPGMNPYLERDSVFGGFQRHFVVALSHALVPQIRPAYFADIEVDVYLHEFPGDVRFMGRPDLQIVESNPAAERPRPHTAVKGPAPTVAPVTSRFRPAVDAIEIPCVKVIDRETRQVITVIEVLRRTNKLDEADRAAYIAKRNQIRRSEVHFIEIDLLRSGEPMPLASQPDSDYRVVLSRHEQRPAVALWPIRLRDRLPVIPVPLRAPDADVSIDLQAVLDRVYDAGGYADYVYPMTPQPPLHPEDARWAEGLLREAGVALP